MGRMKKKNEKKGQKRKNNDDNEGAEGLEEEEWEEGVLTADGLCHWIIHNPSFADNRTVSLLARFLSLIKATTVTVEQAFFMFNNFVKNKFRNRMGNEAVDNHMNVKFNLADLDMSDLLKLCDEFVEVFFSSTRIYRLKKTDDDDDGNDPDWRKRVKDKQKDTEGIEKEDIEENKSETNEDRESGSIEKEKEKMDSEGKVGEDSTVMSLSDQNELLQALINEEVAVMGSSPTEGDEDDEEEADDDDSGSDYEDDGNFMDEYDA